MKKEEKCICKLKTEIKVIQEKIYQLTSSALQYRELTEKAVSKAEAEMNHRLQAMNEFRGQLEKQSATFITRDQIEAGRAGYEIAVKQAVEKFEALIRANTERVERIQVSLTKLEGRVSTSESADAVAATTASRVAAIDNLISNWQGRLYMIGIGWGVVIILISWYLNHH